MSKPSKLLNGATRAFVVTSSTMTGMLHDSHGRGGRGGATLNCSTKQGQPGRSLSLSLYTVESKKLCELFHARSTSAVPERKLLGARVPFARELFVVSHMNCSRCPIAGTESPARPHCTDRMKPNPASCECLRTHTVTHVSLSCMHNSFPTGLHPVTCIQLRADKCGTLG